MTILSHLKHDDCLPFVLIKLENKHAKQIFTLAKPNDTTVVICFYDLFIGFIPARFSLLNSITYVYVYLRQTAQKTGYILLFLTYPSLEVNNFLPT